jgi:hypothetical protein
VQPICIAADAFAPGCPKRDLLLSPDHAVFAEGVLIPIRYLVNGTTVTRQDVESVTYWHVELGAHSVMLAEGLPTESYLDTGNRDNFANAGRVLRLHPNLSTTPDQSLIWAESACAPLHIGGPIVARVGAHLRRRAKERGLFPSRRGRGKLPSMVQTSNLSALLRPAWYLTVYPDVLNSGSTARAHYTQYGRREGRQPCAEIALLRGLGLIDPGQLAFTMSDVVAAGEDPVRHFCQTGWREGRRPNRYFHTGWYVDSYDIPNEMNPLLHYVLFGEGLGLRPCPDFNPMRYRNRFDIPPNHSALAHYLLSECGQDKRYAQHHADRFAV